MMQVSDRAIALLKENLDGQEIPENQVFRLADEQDQIAIRISGVEDGDILYESDGKAVLAAPPAIAERFDGRTIDVEETPAGARFQLL